MLKKSKGVFIVQQQAYINNKETRKIELHFNKEEYLSLPAELKAELKRHFQFSGRLKAWVSRSKNNHHWAIETAKKLGFTEEETKGQRLSYAEELERQAEKAENRAERYEQYAENAEKRAGNLQAEFNSFRGDIAFMTQPIIAGHSGSQAFGRYREKVLNRYRKGFDEYRKSEYFKDRAETARKTANKKQLRNPIYLNNRIEECNKNIRQLEKNAAYYEELIYKMQAGEKMNSFYEDKTIEDVNGWQDNNLEKLEYELDKLAFFKNCMDDVKSALEEVGRKMYSKEDLKPGYLFKRYRFDTWAKVERVNPKTVTASYIEHPLTGLNASCPYAEIKEIKIPEDWQEPKTENPFKVGDIVIRHTACGDRVIAAFQVVKVSAKTVTIQKVKVEEGEPVKDCFVRDKQERKTVKQDRQGNTVLNDDGWYLYRYTI